MVPVGLVVMLPAVGVDVDHHLVEGWEVVSLADMASIDSLAKGMRIANPAHAPEWE